MAKILVLGPSGSGKSSSIYKSEKLGIKGLNPEETFIITATSKPLPVKGGSKLYKVCDITKAPTKENGNRLITNSGTIVAKTMTYISNNRSEIKNIVVDDTNYIMQDYYMANASKKGYDTFKEIGMDFYAIFAAADNLRPDINFIMLAHCEEYKDSNTDSISFRFKTVGKMVTDYLTPEGKFENVFFTKQVFNQQDKKVEKFFVTNYDGQYPAHCAADIFDDIYIPNDLGYVVEKINQFQNEL